jgi:3-deoxy-D-manno-octulosonate 8-phosphate phosphatase (KDO 8-P phosphatase)
LPTEREESERGKSKSGMLAIRVVLLDNEKDLQFITQWGSGRKMDEKQLESVMAIITDVDGVLTDGRIAVSPMGETKTFHVRDGLAIKVAQRFGLEVAILSARHSEPVQIRAKELGIEIVKTGRLDKRKAFHEILDSLAMTPDQVAFVGDDLADLAPLDLAGLAFCPRDAVEEIQQRCDFIVPCNGGDGVLRFVIEMILKAKGVWQSVLEGFEV